MLMTDDTGWNDFGAYTGGGAAPGHPTPNIDRIAKEGALFTSWYGQASCTAGRASFITGRIPIRSALSVVTVPGDLNGLRKETPTIAEFFKKNGYRGLRFRAATQQIGEAASASFLAPHRREDRTRDAGRDSPATVSVDPDARAGYEAFLNDIVAVAQRFGFEPEESPGQGESRLRGLRQ